MSQPLPGRKVPIAHILMGVAGWVACLFVHNKIMVALAILLSLLAVPRFLRGSLAKAEYRASLRLSMPSAPNKRVAKAVAPDEQIVWESSQHPIVLLPWAIGATILTGGAVFLGKYLSWDAAKIVWVLTLIVLAWKVFVWHRERLCLTDQRLLGVWGIIRKRVGTLPVRKLTDETLVIPAHSTILGWLRLIRTEYGTLILESAGQDQALSKVVFIPDALAVNLLIMNRTLR